MTTPKTQTEAPAPTPQSGGPITPTPTPHELNAFRVQLDAGSLPLSPWHHAMDGSAIDPQSPDPTAKTSTWP